jgi:hypothetical protein
MTVRGLSVGFMILKSMTVILRLDIWRYVEARIVSIGLISTLMSPVPVTAVDEPPEEGDEAGEVPIQPADRMRITMSTDKRSGV